MSFLVIARQSAREVCFERNSMLAALEQALTLASSGMQGVTIRDSSGRSRTPAEFGRALLGGRTAFGAAKAGPRAA